MHLSHGQPHLLSCDPDYHVLLLALSASMSVPRVHALPSGTGWPPAGHGDKPVPSQELSALSPRLQAQPCQPPSWCTDFSATRGPLFHSHRITAVLSGHTFLKVLLPGTFLADSGPTHVFHDVCIQVLRFCLNFSHSDAEVRRPAAHSACPSPETLPCRGEEDPTPSKPVTSFLPYDPDCLPHNDQPSVSTHHMTPLPTLHSNALPSKGDSRPNEMVP